MRFRDIDAGFVATLIVAVVLFVATDPARIAPPPFPWSLHPPVIGHYCVATVDGSKRLGIPLGMSIWMSSDMNSPQDSDFACAEMPNPMNGAK